MSRFITVGGSQFLVIKKLSIPITHHDLKERVSGIWKDSVVEGSVFKIRLF